MEEIDFNKKQEKQKLEKNHEFCSKFRADIKKHGLRQVVVELLQSKSEKVGLKKEYLARECGKKPSFAAKVEEALKSVGDSDRSLRPALYSLRSEIIGK